MTGKLANTYADKVHTHLWADITDRPTSLPANGGNADTVDNLHASSFARTDQSSAVDLDTVNGKGIMTCSANVTATAERHYPIQQAGTLFYGTAAYNSANQIYGSFYSNRWFVRGGGTSPTAKTAWAEIWTSANFNPENYLPLSGGKTITGNVALANEVMITNQSGGNLIGLRNGLSEFGDAGHATRIVSNDSDLQHWRGGQNTIIYDSSNSNISTVDWAAKNITAAGTVTAPTFVGALSGTATRCYGLAINNSAGESNCLQFMQTLSQNDAGDLPNSNWYHILKFNHGNGDTYYNRTLALPFYSDDIYTRRRVSGTAYSWVALFGEHNANRSDTNWTANTLTATKLVLGGITIDVYNGALRVNGNLVATGGVTSLATA